MYKLTVAESQFFNQACGAQFWRIMGSYLTEPEYFALADKWKELKERILYHGTVIGVDESCNEYEINASFSFSMPWLELLLFEECE